MADQLVRPDVAASTNASCQTGSRCRSSVERGTGRLLQAMKRLAREEMSERHDVLIAGSCQVADSRYVAALIVLHVAERGCWILEEAVTWLNEFQARSLIVKFLHDVERG